MNRRDYNTEAKNSISEYADLLSEQDDTTIARDILLSNFNKTVDALKSLKENEYESQKTSELLRVIQNSVCFITKLHLDEYLYKSHLHEIFEKLMDHYLESKTKNEEQLCGIFGTLNTLTAYFEHALVENAVHKFLDNAMSILMMENFVSEKTFLDDVSFYLYERILGFINSNSMHVKGRRKLNNLNAIETLNEHLKQINSLLNVRNEVKYAKLWLALTIVNLLSDEKDENPKVDFKDIVETLTNMFNKAFEASEKNTKIFDNTKYFISYTIDESITHIKLDRIMIRLLNLVVIRHVSFDNKLIDSLSKLVVNGNDGEIECACELICYLLLENDVKEKKRLKDNERLMEKIKNTIKTTENMQTKLHCRLIIYLVTSSNIDGNTAVETVKSKIMISYYRDEFVDMPLFISKKLEESGLSVWIDYNQPFYDLYNGNALTDHYFKATVSAINDASVILICCSEQYKKSVYCRFEARYAIEKNKKLVFVNIQPGYKADGWLAKIMASKPNYDLNQIDELIKNMVKNYLI